MSCLCIRLGMYNCHCVGPGDTSLLDDEIKKGWKHEKGIQFKVWDRHGLRDGELVLSNNQNRFWMNIVGGKSKVQMTGEGHPTATHAHRAVDRVWSGFHSAAGLQNIQMLPAPYHKESLLPKGRSHRAV